MPPWLLLTQLQPQSGCTSRWSQYGSCGTGTTSVSIQSCWCCCQSVACCPDPLNTCQQQLPTTYLSCLMLVLSEVATWCPINLRPPPAASRGPRVPMRSIMGFPPSAGAGCWTVVVCVFWLVLTELPPSALGLQLPLAQPAMTSCLHGHVRQVATAVVSWWIVARAMLRASS